MSVSKKIKLVALVGVAFLLMRITGVTFADLWSFSSEKVSNFHEDSKSLASGEYQEKVAKALRESASREKQPLAVVEDLELQQDLALARKELLEGRAAALEKHAGNIIRGDVNTLKRQVAENARIAGGNN